MTHDGSSSPATSSPTHSPSTAEGSLSEGDRVVIVIVIFAVIVSAVIYGIYRYIKAKYRVSRSPPPLGLDGPAILVEDDVQIKKIADGPVMLFHQTDAAAASMILSTQKFIPGSSGSAGPGIYFATSAADTNRKARQKGVVLSATVDLGMTLVMETANYRLTAESVTSVGADSVLVTCFHGAEYVIYDSSRISNIELCGSDMQTDGYDPLKLGVALPAPSVPLHGAPRRHQRGLQMYYPRVGGAPVLDVPSPALFMVQQPLARDHHIVDVAMQPDRDGAEQPHAHRGGRQHRSRSVGRRYRHFTPPPQERVERAHNYERLPAKSDFTSEAPAKHRMTNWEPSGTAARRPCLL